ncbi:MAG: AI-2E family transporter [Thiothrix litoralis]|jgi:predicted PurR-regulated permease PerM|uniref:AI-2E family transporter n=1 Tax=Thiothrix litoralis TaxID=2891210 RepID=UPI003C73C093
MQTSSLKNLQIPLWGLFTISLLGMLYLAKAIFIPVFLAVLASFVLTPAVRLLQQWHIPRALGSALILGVFSSVIIIAFNLLSEPASMWFERLPTEIRQIEHKISLFKDSIENVQETTQKFEEITSITKDGEHSPQVVVKGPNMLFTLLGSTQSFLLGILSFAVLLFFLLAFGDSLARGITKLWNNRSDQTAMISVARDARTQISYYLMLVTAINTGLGILVALLMWATGMPNPLVWGASTAILNFIPYLGPAINLGIVTLVAVLTFDTPARMLLPPLALLGLNMLEGQFVQPLFVGKMFTINPILVFLSVLGWGWLWGMAGVFMAVPLLMIGTIVWDKSREREAT